jgi:hypothetical protein
MLNVSVMVLLLSRVSTTGEEPHRDRLRQCRRFLHTSGDITIASVWFDPRTGVIHVWLKRMDNISPEPGFCEISSKGTLIHLKTTADVSRAVPYLQASYDAT